MVLGLKSPEVTKQEYQKMTIYNYGKCSRRSFLKKNAEAVLGLHSRSLPEPPKGLGWYLNGNILVGRYKSYLFSSAVQVLGFIYGRVALVWW